MIESLNSLKAFCAMMGIDIRVDKKALYHSYIMPNKCTDSGAWWDIEVDVPTIIIPKEYSRFSVLHEIGHIWATRQGLDKKGYNELEWELIAWRKGVELTYLLEYSNLERIWYFQHMRECLGTYVDGAEMSDSAFNAIMATEQARYENV